MGRIRAPHTLGARVARCERRLVAGCAAGCGILQSISSAVEVPAVADLNAHPLFAPIQGHRRSRSAPVSELAQIDLLVPCAFR